jgi:N-alpha-acetyl-L-2,4-diaminobutyrate deacetylase
MRENPIVPTVDLDKDGVQHGFLRLPWSRDESAWGNLMIPIAVIRNGDGPTALLTGANHGDEYEGPIALADLARTLRQEEMRGRVIVVPFMNFPAFRGARRVSPIDGGNLNRLFPGRPDGTVTEKIADLFQRTLVPLADIVLDFHSGGRTLDFVPFAASHVLADKVQEARCLAARDAFGAPYAMKMLEIDATGMYDTAAEALGKTFVTTELGGGGTATARTIAIAKRGVHNVLKHAGILDGAPERAQSIELDMPNADCFTFSQSAGLVEFCLDLAAPVRKGDLLARVHATDRLGLAPEEYRARMNGILAARHFPGLIGMGDCLAVVAVPVEPSSPPR